MRKRIYLLAVVVMCIAALMLTGCGNNSSTDETFALSSLDDSANETEETETEEETSEEGTAAAESENQETSSDAAAAGVQGSSAPSSASGTSSAASSGTSAAATQAASQATETTAQAVEYVTVSISCSEILSHRDDFTGDWSLVPSNGVILGTVSVPVYEGETVWNVTNRACSANGIAVSNTGNYIPSMGGLSERDAGPTSGWTYYVNGQWATVGVDEYTVHAGDSITWNYVTSW